MSLAPFGIKAVGESDFAVAIAQPGDIVGTPRARQSTLRDNVLFEPGILMGRLTRHRPIRVHPRVKDLKLPSDLHGLTLVSTSPANLKNSLHGWGLPVTRFANC